MFERELEFNHIKCLVKSRDWKKKMKKRIALALAFLVMKIRKIPST